MNELLFYCLAETVYHDRRDQQRHKEIEIALQKALKILLHLVTLRPALREPRAPSFSNYVSCETLRDEVRWGSRSDLMLGSTRSQVNESAVA